MKTYKIKIRHSNTDYLYMSNQEPCQFIVDLAKCESIEVKEIDRTSVESINEISNLYQSVGNFTASSEIAGGRPD